MFSIIESILCCRYTYLALKDLKSSVLTVFRPPNFPPNLMIEIDPSGLMTPPGVMYGSASLDTMMVLQSSVNCNISGLNPTETEKIDSLLDGDFLDGIPHHTSNRYFVDAQASRAFVRHGSDFIRTHIKATFEESAIA